MVIGLNEKEAKKFNEVVKKFGGFDKESIKNYVVFEECPDKMIIRIPSELTVELTTEVLPIVLELKETSKSTVSLVKNGIGIIGKLKDACNKVFHK